MTLKVLIADDEPLARERLRLLLSSDAEFVVAAECRNGKEVIAAIETFEYDVLFLDIQMPGSNGFEIIEQVGTAKMPTTVFVTAHNEFAIQAFEVNALDYLTKPVELARLQKSLARVREKVAARSIARDANQWISALSALEKILGAQTEYPSRLIVPHGNKEVFIKVTDIDWIEAADYYASLHVGAKSYMIREPIKVLAQRLNPQQFVRIHRSIIVNVSRISEIFREGRSEGAVVLLSGERLRMSRAGWQTLLSVSNQ